MYIETALPRLRYYFSTIKKENLLEPQAVEPQEISEVIQPEQPRCIRQIVEHYEYNQSMSPNAQFLLNYEATVQLADGEFGFVDTFIEIGDHSQPVPPSASSRTLELYRGQVMRELIVHFFEPTPEKVSVGMV